MNNWRRWRKCGRGRKKEPSKNKIKKKHKEENSNQNNPRNGSKLDFFDFALLCFIN